MNTMADFRDYRIEAKTIFIVLISQISNNYECCSSDVPTFCYRNNISVLW